MTASFVALDFFRVRRLDLSAECSIELSPSAGID